MTIKLSDYIENPEEAITDEEWIEIYTRALIDSGEFDEKLAEELMEVSNEALKIELENGSIIEAPELKGVVVRGKGRWLFPNEEEEL